MNKRQRQSVLWLGLLVGTALGVYGLLGAGQSRAAESSEFAFTDVPNDTRRFTEYNKSIKLTPHQEQIRREALSSLSAPCCSNKTAYTCCCPCNMAKAWWGLSKHLIADRSYEADEVRQVVSEWFQIINTDGFSGEACYTRGGCNRPFSHDGCGGMNEKNLILDSPRKAG